MSDDKSPGIKTVDNAKRYVDTYDGINMYVIIGDKESNGKPFSVMVSITDQSINGNLKLLSLLETIVILTSMVLRKYTVEKVIEGLEKGSRTPLSFPAIIAKKLKRYVGGE